MNPANHLAWAIVPAAGAGRRMLSAQARQVPNPVPKQYQTILGKTMLEHSLACLLKHPKIVGVVVVIAADDFYWPTLNLSTPKPIKTVIGGLERSHSVLNALQFLQAQVEPNTWILVHDAARPCLRYTDLERLFNSLYTDAVGGLLAAPVRDTLKKTSDGSHVHSTLDRQNLWQALTPQMFRFEILFQAMLQGMQTQRVFTDESSAVEYAGFSPRLVEGCYDNIKVTTQADLDLATSILARSHYEK